MAIILLACVTCSCHNQPTPFDGDTFVKGECLFHILGECYLFLFMLRHVRASFVVFHQIAFTQVTWPAASTLLLLHLAFCSGHGAT